MTATLPRAVSTPLRTPARRSGRPMAIVPTIVLALGALYCFLPLIWLFTASTKTPGELFTTFSFTPSFNGGFTGNLRDLAEFRGGVYGRWVLNSLLYAGGGALLSTAVSGMAGYALAKYRFAGRQFVFVLLLLGALVPGVMLAVPQYLLLSAVGLAGTSWSVLLPGIISPLGMYLCRVYAAASVPDEILEAARVDGAGELRAFGVIAVPTMVPGLITVFLLQFVGIWNNFLLPFIMLADDQRFPLTVGLYSMMNMGLEHETIYTMVIIGAFLAVIPLIALFLLLQRFWRLDLATGALKG
ncbi:carbohydrate ABC transporter permease [Microlunatus sp. GCM10028923]|uniref:carbohydrate ABC transporter permease n=1 Tax=Microlunatus sp. GCM10028923 TaxID=3273400 RepID=UPI00360893EA